MWGREFDYRQFRDHAPDSVIGFDADGEPALIEAFGGASASVDGYLGLVPKPFISDRNYFLAANGTWEQIAPGPTAAVPCHDGSGKFKDSNLVVNPASNSIFFKDNANLSDIPIGLGIDTEGGYMALRVKGRMTRYQQSGIWASVNASASSGNQDRLISSLNDWVARLEITSVGMKADGTEGYSSVKVATFRRDGSADPVQVDTTSTLSEQRDDNVEDPTVDIELAPSGGLIRVSYTSGGVDGYQWTFFYTLTFMTLG